VTQEAVLRPAPNPIDALTGLLADDLRRVDLVIHARMESGVAMIPSLAGYLIDAGGKRIRPLITLAAARLLARASGRGGPAPDAAVLLAAAVEFIHTATLLHDDVVDDSGLRRGKAPANRVWGNAASVLVGDFLFARAFDLMVEAGDLTTLGVLSRASTVIAEGEVMQLTAAGQADTSLDRYMAIVGAKTAALFAAAAKVGAMAAGASVAQAQAMEAYGQNLGLAFQLIDDVLDYGGAASAMGKNIGDDFREGKVTLPVILAREAGDAEEAAFWRRVMSEGGVGQQAGDFEHAIGLMRRRNALGRTIEFARVYAEAARAAVGAVGGEPVWADALLDLPDFVIERAF
jgi:octaprenyl-diphosphate synthase